MKRPMSAKRLIAVGLSPGLLFLAVDSAIAHFAGKGIEQGPQMIPILFGVFGATLLGMLGLPFLRRVNFVPSRLIVRLVALGSMVVGAAGTGFHLVPLLKDLSDEPFSLSALEGALAVSPPLFAPAAFIGVGMVLYFLASPQLSLRLRPAPAQELDAELGDERQPITATQTLG